MAVGHLSLITHQCHRSASGAGQTLFQLQPAVLQDDRVDHLTALHATPRRTIKLTGITRKIEA
jgi:hypothetical protein